MTAIEAFAVCLSPEACELRDRVTAEAHSTKRSEARLQELILQLHARQLYDAFEQLLVDAPRLRLAEYDTLHALLRKHALVGPLVERDRLSTRRHPLTRRAVPAGVS